MLKALKKLLASSRRFRTLAFLLSMVLILTAVAGTSLSFIVTHTPSLHNIFVNGLAPTGELVIRKTVEHPFGGEYAVPDNIAFAFQVDLGAENAGEIFGSLTADENGVVSVTVRAGGAVTIHGIKTGTAVTVTEQTAGAGFSVKDGETAKQTVIEKGVTTIEFINAYRPEAASGGLTVTGVKELAGRDWQEGDSFTFQLAIFENGGWTSLGTDTVEYRLIEMEDPDDPGQTIWAPGPDFNKFDLSGLLQNVRFDEAGTYAFRVTEVEGSVGGVTYDKAESRFDVLVGDADMDGQLEIQSVTSASSNTQAAWNEEAGAFGVSIAFENRYAPVGSAEAVVQIKKILDDTSGQNRTPEGFTFGLYGGDGELYKTSEATSAAGETSIRLVYEPADAGKTFTYTLKEVNGGQTIDGVTYDGTEIKIQVSVVDNLDGTVSALVYEYQEAEDGGDGPAAEEGGSSPDDVEQTPDEPVPEEPDAPVLPETPDRSDEPGSGDDAEQDTEEDGGGEAPAPEEGPALEETHADEPVLDGAADSGETAPDGDQPVSGEGGEAVPADTSPENDGGTEPVPEAGDEPDGSGEEVSAAPAAENDEPDAAPDIPRDAASVYEARFKNVYDPADAHVSLSGDKDLTGRAMKAGEFDFLLYKTGSDFAVPEGAEPVASVSNSDTDGSFTFELTLGAVGTYYYVVTEDASAQLGGVSYDDARYLVTVHVTDAGGALTADVSVTSQTGEEHALTFRNTYSAAKAVVELIGGKTLTGMALAAGDFTFDLYQADEAFAPTGTALQSVENGGDGSFAFGELSFAEEGTWYYVVKENASAPIEGVVYDTTEYRVTVTVTDNGAGALVPAVEMTAFRDGRSASAQSIAFENRYSAANATVTLGGEKVLKGAALESGMFSFLLYEADENYVAQGGVIRRAVNDGDGAFTFDALTYEAEGTYYYTVVEDSSAPDEGIVYDGTAYGVMVTVRDDGSGQLTAKTAITKAGQAADAIRFENSCTLASEETTVDIGIQKTVDNTGSRTIGPEGFAFVLTNVETGDKSITKSDKDGRAAFTLTFNRDDAGKTYHYTLAEVTGAEKGVTYSDAVYEFEIAISVNGYDQVQAEVTSGGKAVAQLTAEFVNVYDGGAGSTGGHNGPKTGDGSDILLYAVLLAVCGGGLALLPVIRKRRGKN